jgi:isopentenyl-diphosphate delta-isomerase
MEDLILVDPQNTVLGTAPKNLCHDGEGILHRAFSIFVFNNKMELLLQKRATEKRLWPGYWSNSCCSHPSLNESMISAAKRRLGQELGIKGFQISELYRFEYQASYLDLGSENELCSVLICRSDDDLAINRAEVCAIRWVTMPDLEAEIEKHPEQFTPWFKLEAKQLTSNYLQQIQGMYSG